MGMVESVKEMRPQSAAGGLLMYWAPPIIWMSMIFWFSTDMFSGDNTGSLLWKVVSFIYPGVTQELFDSIHFYVRKAGHFTEYAVLALLLFRAFRSGAQARWRRWTGSVYDSLIDTSGAATALVLLWLYGRRIEKSLPQRSQRAQRKNDE